MTRISSNLPSMPGEIFTDDYRWVDGLLIAHQPGRNIDHPASQRWPVLFGEDDLVVFGQAEDRDRTDGLGASGELPAFPLHEMEMLAGIESL